MMRRLKIIDQDNFIDGIYALAYLSLAASVIISMIFPFNIMIMVSLASFSIAIYRDEILRAKPLQSDLINKELAELRYEISAIKINQSMR